MIFGIMPLLRKFDPRTPLQRSPGWCGRCRLHECTQTNCRAVPHSPRGLLPCPFPRETRREITMRHNGSCRSSIRSLVSTRSSGISSPPRLLAQHFGGAIYSAASASATTAATTTTPAPARRALLRNTTRCQIRRGVSTAALSAAHASRRPTQQLNAPSRSFLSGSGGDTSAPMHQQQAMRRVPVECGVVSPRRGVPDHIPKTPYYATGVVPPQDNIMHLHTAETLVPMREACVLARDMLDLCCAMAQPGVTTDAIDAAAHAAIIEAGACPSPLNYHGFPKSVCSSVNEIACHAIPDDRPLQDGDLVSFDVSVFLKGFHGDNCATVGVGAVDAAGQRLVDATQEAMMEGVSVCRPGACLTEIGSAIHDVADRYGFDTVQKYCGHGVGTSFHMLPFVQHFRNNHQLELVPGMTFTIEPIFTEGSEATTLWPDAWTVQTLDGGRAAQFEHVVLITEEGHEVLTVPSQP